MRLEVQLKYNTGFETIEVCHDERSALEAMKAYKRRGYKARVTYGGEVCRFNERAYNGPVAYVVRRFIENGRKVTMSGAPWNFPA